MTTATLEAKLDKDTFNFEGEFLDLTGAEAYELLAEYRAAAAALHAAKKLAFDAEEKIKARMRGYESLRIDGEVKVTWKWEALTKFDKQKLAREHLDILNTLTTRVPDGKRVFSAKGVVGVE